MNRGFGIRAVVLLTLAVAGALLLGRSRPDAESQSKAARLPKAVNTSSKLKPSEPMTGRKDAPKSGVETKTNPRNEAALKHYRVTATDSADGTTFTGADYRADVRATGLSMESKGVRVALKPTALSHGARTTALGAGTPSRTGPNTAEVARTGVVEQYVFENDRVEQLFRIDQATSAEVSVRMSAEHNLPGGGFSERKAGRQTWRDSTLLSDAVVLTDEAGQLKAAYHSAKVIDAAGRELEISPRLDGNEIVLAVPAAFMAAASYPVLIDPWLEFNFSASGGGVTGTQKVSESVAMALDGSGNPYIVWSDNSAGNYEIYLKYFNGFEWKDLGGSGTGAGISSTPGASSHPCIAFRGAGGQSVNPNNADSTYGFIAVAWDDNSNFGDYEIYCKVWDGTVWKQLAGSATAGGVSTNLGQDTYPTIGYVNAYESFPTLFADDIHSVPIIAWQQDRQGASEIVASFLWPADEIQVLEAWERVGAGNGNVSNTPSRVSDRPRMVIDRFGRPFVAWSDSNNGNYEIYIRALLGPNNGLGAGDLLNNEFYLAKVFNGSVTTYRASGAAVPVTWAEIQASGSGGGVSVTAAGHSLYPSLAIDSGDGSLFVAWEELTAAGSNILVAASRTAGVLAPGIPQAGNYSAWNGLDLVAGPDNISGTNTARYPSIGLQPAGGVLAAVPFVAWQDETAAMPAPQNPEIFVAQFSGGAWVDVGDAGSRAAARGISNTDNFSYLPILQTDALGQPVVAWIDGAFGSYDVYLRKFFVNEAVINPTDTGAALLPAPLTAQLGQYLISNPLTPLAVGGNTTEQGVRLRAILKAETSGGVAFTRLQVELRPLNNPFIGTQILESNPIIPVVPATTNGVVAEIIFYGLPNVQWAWRGRAVDDIGRASPWVSFASNGDSGVDFEIRQPVVLPVPSAMQQYRLNGTTVIGLAATSPENSVVLSGSIVPPNASTTVRLEVEVQRVGTALTGTATGTSASVSAASTVAIAIPPLGDGSFHWAARSVASDGSSTAWTEFGGNTSTTAADFSLLFTPPALLAQFRLDGTTPITQGGISEQSGVTLSGVVTAPATGLQVRLDVEVKPITQAFDGATGIISSANVASGSTVAVQVTGLAFDNYHWRARTTSSINTSSAWTSFGTNADGQTDFQLFVQPPPVDIDDDKDNCGLLGVEFLLIMGALALRRRRTRV